jgi:hypothetical protein
VLPKPRNVVPRSAAAEDDDDADGYGMSGGPGNAGKSRGVVFKLLSRDSKGRFETRQMQVGVVLSSGESTNGLCLVLYLQARCFKLVQQRKSRLLAPARHVCAVHQSLTYRMLPHCSGAGGQPDGDPAGQGGGGDARGEAAAQGARAADRPAHRRGRGERTPSA